MCAELHKAIADSLKESNQRLTEDSRLRGKRKRNEGFYAEFDESQDSSVTTTDFTYTESTRNTESHSDMELCDSDQECVRRVVGEWGFKVIKTDVGNHVVLVNGLLKKLFIFCLHS